MKTSKRVISLLLCAIMVMTSFVVAAPMLKLGANAATTIDGITQERVVGTDGSYKTKYDNYAAQFLNGASAPTNIVIPGLNSTQDYVVQGMTYYPKRDWMLVTAYHNVADGETTQSSKVFALDAATGEFVAMFSFLNPDGSPNTEHGGGIAVSENNIYYACGDDDRQIAYAPISAFENAPLNQHTVVKLVDMVDFNEIGSVTSSSKTAYTAYVCYDDGVLWTGNFYDMGVKIFGVSVAATDYSVPANNDYHSMVFGYRLAGNSSSEEWQYLMGNVTGKDCRGNPSYVIGLNNSIKDVQYAVVDNGKLYLSCSFGTGEGTNSVTLGGMNPYSTLVVADIDLTQPGTKSTTINTHNGSKTVKAYDIQDCKSFSMMPMSEGLCVINDKIFITFEGASNKYLTEAGMLTGNCNHPVDVIWELDPYELMETTVTEPEKSIYYEKIYSSSQLKDGDEYIIVHESKQKDPVSQKNYLYALNAEGNLKGLELSKSSADVIRGYDAMIGHPISYYSFEKGINGEDILYLEHPENDDIANIRWTINKNGDGDKYSIKNTSTYFANYNSLYFNQNKITMMPTNASQLSNIYIGQLAADSGYFYLSNAGKYYLWCNDGLVANYNNKANTYYENNAAAYPLLDGVTETPGTFHCDAMNESGANILGGQIDVTDDNPNILYEDRAFQIYRRVVDEVASTYESRVYTDLDAELQEDGTYTITLETYAISPNHYQYVGERPTDYIIVADTSSSMGEKGSTGINEYTGALSVDSMSTDDNTSDDNGAKNSEGKTDIVIGYGFSEEDIYFKHEADGKYYKGYMAIRNVFKITNVVLTKVWSLKQQYYYLYYIADDGYYYCYTNQESTPSLKYTQSEFKAWVAGNGVLQTASSTEGTNTKRKQERLITGLHYRFDDVNSSHTGEHYRINTLKNAANDLIDQIAAQNSQNRIALVQYGANNGFYNTSGSLSTTDYANAFWSTSEKDTLKSKVKDLTTGTQSDNNGIELTYANNIITNSGVDYKSGGKRNVAIIFISDGIPGADGGSSTTAAANAVIQKALTAKNDGAFIYTVLVGNNSVSGFNKKSYMDGVSSKYAAASSITSLGGQSVDGVNYAMSLATTTMTNFVNFGAITTEEVAYNAAVGLDNLSDASYLRQQLSEAFKFPDNFNNDTDFVVELITGEFDEIGRFSFDEGSKDLADNVSKAKTIKEASGIDKDSKTLTITSYDYAKEYIARNRTDGDGRKLRVTISGLLADETKQIRNTSINNTETTGLYKTKGNMENNVEFRMLPTSYFNIPKYTYVLDYGVAMYDSDVNGTLKSVESDLSRIPRDANGNLMYNTESENKLLEITNKNLDLIYRSTPTNYADSGYCLIQRDDGTYDWFEIEVVPASNVLFEEDQATTTGTGVAWTKDGTTKVAYQSLTNEHTDVYGYDDVYADGANAHSFGSADKATVSNSAKRSATKTFDFIGEGIDLISACGENTGIMIVKISGGNLESPKAYIVDTYYGDGAVSGLICQTPIVSFKGDYGTYTVEATAAYLSSAGAINKKNVTSSSLANGKFSAAAGTPVSDADVAELLAQVGMEDLASADLEMVWFDDNSILNGGTGAKGNVKTARDGSTVTSLDCYLDGFRIYHPMKHANDDYISSEKDAQYINVLDRLIEVDEQTGTPTLLDGIAYVAGQFKEDENGVKPTLSFANYQELGPQNELYLNSGNDGIVVKVALPNPNSKVQLGLRAVTGKAKVTVSSDAGAHSFEVNSATEMYYDISKCLSGGSPEATITIKSTEGLLAVNNIKLTGAGAVAVVEESDLEEAAMYMSADPVRANVVNGVVTPVTDGGDTTEPDNGNVNIPGSDVVNKAPSFVQELIAKLFEILSQIFSFLPVGEVM